MTDHQKETAFLRHCIRYGESAEHQALEETITRIQRDERCLQRAVWLMAALTALVVAAISYPAILMEDFPYTMPQFVVNLVCAVGMASLISLLAFVGFGLVCRKKLNQHREECRQLITRLLESRLGKPDPTPWRERLVGSVDRETVQVAVGADGRPDRTESIAPG